MQIRYCGIKGSINSGLFKHDRNNLDSNNRHSFACGVEVPYNLKYFLDQASKVLFVVTG